MFKHELKQFSALKAVELQLLEDNQSARYYRAPSGDWYPSVTTVMSAFPNQGLLDWKSRVGEEEAARVGNTAAYRGSMLHGLCEQYLKNEPIDDNVHPFYKALFNKVKKELDIHLGTVYGIEFPLHSDVIKVAGRGDLCAQWDDVPAIIDFKTSTQIKPVEWVQGYFEQMSAYAVMFEERTGLNIPKIVVVLATENVPCYWYESKPSKHIANFLKKRHDYDKIEQERLDKISS